MIPAVLALSALLAASAASADTFLPQGSADTTLHLDATYQKVGEIAGLNDVHGMAGAPRRGLLIAGSLSVQAPAQIERPAVVSEDEHAAHHGGDPEAAAAEVGLVTIVDANSHSVVRRIEVPGMVHHVAVSTDERWALVTHPGLDSVSLIDLDAMRLSATLFTGPIPEYAVADPVTGRFFVSNTGNATISELDPASATVLRAFRTVGGPKHMRLLPEARQLVIAATGPSLVAVLDADTGATLESYEIGGDLHGIDADADTIFTSARGLNKVVRIDRRSGARSEAEIGPAPYHMALAGSDLLVTSSAVPVLWVLDPGTLALKRAIETADTVHQLVTTRLQ